MTQERFHQVSGKFLRKHMVIRKWEIYIVNREIKIFTKGLYENNSEIELSSPVKYLRKCNFHQI